MFTSAFAPAALPARQIYRFSLCLLLCSLTGLTPRPASAHQPAAPLTRAITGYLSAQTQGLGAETRIQVTPLDARNQLPPCQEFEISLPPGTRLWGRISVEARCVLPANWKIRVPVHVQVFGNYLASRRSLPLGQTLEAADLMSLHGDLTLLPEGLLQDAQQATGRITTQALAAGQPLRREMLRELPVIQQNQSVKVVARGPGFVVSAGDGRALNSAAVGRVVQVRMSNGRVISGLAQADGSVDIDY